MAKPVYNYPSSPGSTMSIKRNKRTRANPYVHTMHAGSAVIHPVIQPGGELVRKNQNSDRSSSSTTHNSKRVQPNI
ncbi:hypothetical protein BO83DRAFT_91415 [Aspergillus eucalypticola CBS 122712]|uniref:Uncharacterized protein n=1 Tax=Aspergillus eucalypticola (strain CBS 122712 / IBT 29274) TaxID=1448314 RepID=A0A317V1Z4_ASPEC|nr:uncharacterized protein BO83DRAFT_91415 [Aspergillus eucalypticola CBS 122712]PWY68334.1 hypothetical protein BO83DRAFT_91415 [Aspergillus eucalypticola CBS 122712]